MTVLFIHKRKNKLQLILTYDRCTTHKQIFSKKNHKQKSLCFDEIASSNILLIVYVAYRYY